jgi:hypothetical protein
MSSTHIIKLPNRTGKLEVIEEPTRIVLKLRFDKYGALGDEIELATWMAPIFMQYDTDPRPLVMDNPNHGEVATIFGNAENGMAIIQKTD